MFPTLVIDFALVPVNNQEFSFQINMQCMLCLIQILYKINIY